MRVHMVGGPKDGRSYNYPEPLPKLLTFQRFDLNSQAHADDYRRLAGTDEYHYVEPGTLPESVPL